jgi:MYXO-CTERM domain-containing protein
VAIAATATCTAASAAQVWVAPASQKVRPLTPVPQPAPTAAAIAAAKNEFEAFHVVVTGPATGVSMSFSGLSDGNGNTISGRDVVLYREALIDILQQTGGDGATGWWPDALVPDVDPIVGEKRNAFPFDVPAGENRTVYVDVHVPANTPAGTYTGMLNVTGGATAQVPVTLTVWDFAIPSTSTLQSAFGMTWNGPCMGHGDSKCSNMAYEQALRARYVQAALDNRISISVPDISVPVSTTGTSNWASFDQYGGTFLSGQAATRLQGAKLTAVEIYASQTTTPVVQSWSNHFKANGWYPAIFNYVCDEPPLTCAWTDIPPRIAASRAGDPSLTTLVTTQPYTAAANGIATGSIDRYVAVINFMEDRPGTALAGSQRANWPANIWLYQGCMSFGCSGVSPGVDATAQSGWPSYAIDTDATRNRALEWMSYTFNSTGELYYEMTQAYFSGDPWVSQQAFGGNGDGTLFYPGTVAKIGGQTEIPVESLRLKGIRDGMEDYELLHLADSLGYGAQAKQIALGVYPHAYQGYTTPAALDTARAQLAAIILHALGKDTTGSGTGAGGTGSSGGSADAGVASGGTDAGTSDPGICQTTACNSTPTATPTPTVNQASVGGGGCSSGDNRATLWFLAFAIFLIPLRRRRYARSRS